MRIVLNVGNKTDAAAVKLAIETGLATIAGNGEGGVLEIPCGEYAIADSINVDFDDIIIKGQSPGVVFKLDASASMVNGFFNFTKGPNNAT